MRINPAIQSARNAGKPDNPIAALQSDGRPVRYACVQPDDLIPVYPKNRMPVRVTSLDVV